jgi:hypothetical protein
MALSAARNTLQIGLGVPQRTSYPVLASTIIYKGSLVAVDSSGYAKPAVSATALTIVGRAEETIDNSAGSSGDLDVNVTQGVFAWAVNGSAVTIADIGTLCWAYDDATITKTSTSRSIAGTIYGVTDDNQALVYSGLAAPVDSSTLSSFIASIASTANGAGASLVGVEDADTLLTATNVEAALAEIIKVANAGNAGPVNFPVVLSTATSGSTVARFIPTFAGKIDKIAATVRAAGTSSSKAAQIGVTISGTAVTGAVLSLSTTNCTTLGALITGNAASGTANAFTAGQEIALVVNSATTFSDGEAHVLLFLKSA